MTDDNTIAAMREAMKMNAAVGRDATAGVIADGLTLIESQAAEIERLRSGGCARDQGLTQYCAEAMVFAGEVSVLRAEVEVLTSRVAELENPWRPIDDEARNGAQWLIVLSDRRRMVGQYAGHQWRANGCHYDGDQVVAYATLPPAPETED